MAAVAAVAAAVRARGGGLRTLNSGGASFQWSRRWEIGPIERSIGPRAWTETAPTLIAAVRHALQHHAMCAAAVAGFRAAG